MSQSLKTYVLDTNVLLSDTNAINSFEEHHVIIPMAVLEELDRHKSRQDEVGRNARQVSRDLDELRQLGSLTDGVKLVNSGVLKVVAIDHKKLDSLPLELQAPKVDNLIIALMLQLKDQNKENPCVLVSKDINVRIKCDALGIKCEDYLKMRVTSDSEKFYKGVSVVEVPSMLIENFYRQGQDAELYLPDNVLEANKFFPNQIVVVKSDPVEQAYGKSVKSALTKCIKHGDPLVPIRKIEKAFGLVPKNKEQSFSLDLLFDPEVKLLTLTGPSGCGKTLLALASALEQLKSVGAVPLYDKLIVTRPVQPVGKDIGFLPGTMEEKMEPWISPIRDNLNFLMNNGKKASNNRRNKPKDAKGTISDDHYLSLLQEKGLIEIEAITFIRGRSIPNSFIIIDEAQNLSIHELKTIITRVGEGTKIVLTGDLEQIDNVHVDMYTNGLTFAVEKFKDYPIAGHVTFIKGERSPLATLASKIL